MTKFPYKSLFLGILLPPVFYMITLSVLEMYLQRYEVRNIDKLLIQNQEALYAGRYTVREEINRNLTRYLKQSWLTRLGVSIEILVKTQNDRILYPSHYEDELMGVQERPGLAKIQEPSLDYVQVAEENYRILNSSLILSAEVSVRHNSWLSNGILALYVLSSIFILYCIIVRHIRETENQATEREDLLNALSTRLRETEGTLKEVQGKEDYYREKVADLRSDKNGLSEDVDGLLKEMENLENALSSQKILKEGLEAEIVQLRDELASATKQSKETKKRRKPADATRKRFRFLYKNILFTDHSIEGFLSLPEDFKLKAEETIQRLNENPTQVSVKRKVFGKGGKKNVFEAEFSYSGRVYFQSESQTKTSVVTIGTKNTQDRDLHFVENWILAKRKHGKEEKSDSDH